MECADLSALCPVATCRGLDLLDLFRGGACSRARLVAGRSWSRWQSAGPNWTAPLDLEWNMALLYDYFIGHERSDLVASVRTLSS